MKRKSITPAMKINALIYRHNVVCGICGGFIEVGDEIEWDHIHAISMDGPHEYQNIRPTHAACNQDKGIKEHKAAAKVDRILGLTKSGPKKKIPSRPFQKRPVKD